MQLSADARHDGPNRQGAKWRAKVALVSISTTVKLG
jgi:hypothetical protein